MTRSRIANKLLNSYEIDPDTGCWLYTGYLNADGYGQVFVDGKMERVHRISHEIFKGAIPEGFEVDHTCHNADPDCLGGATCPHRRCFNPEHIESVEGLENIRRGKAGIKSGIALSAMTHCRKGHAFDEENTYLFMTRSGRPARHCRACRKEISKRRSKAVSA